MKKVLLISGIIVVLLLGGLLLLPIIFKDDIQASVQKALNEQLKAEAIFDVDRMSLSLFSSFPDLSISVEDFGLIGTETFRGDTLLWVKAFGLTLDLASVLSGDYKINEIYLDQANIYVQVTEEGEASYDIVKATDSTAEEDAPTDTTTTTFSLEIEEWRITEANLLYDDKASKIYAHIQGLTHAGSGNFSQDIFDLGTETRISAIEFAMDGESYLSGQSFSADLVVAINNLDSRYTLKENRIQLSDFVLELKGEVDMKEDAPRLSLSFSSPETSIKSLLSLIPSTYMKDFQDLQTDGQLSFEGSIKGSYEETSLPAFSVRLEVKDGTVSYPDLPSRIDRLAVVVQLEHPEGAVENTTVDISGLEISMGKNALKGELHLKNLRNYDHTANFSLHADLEEVLRFAPQEDITLKGRFDIDIQTAGVYDEASHTFPTVSADIRLNNGYAKHSDYDVPVERIGLRATVTNTTGRMADTELYMEQCELFLEGRRFFSKLRVSNLDNYTWDFDLQGGLDLAKITKIFPIEGSRMSGQLSIDLHSKGQYSDVEAERYDAIYATGSVSLQDFSYESDDLPLPFGISEARLAFSSRALELQRLSATLGSTKLNIQGSLRNYIGYAMREKEVLRGNIQLQSPKIVVSELLTEEEESSSDPSSSTEAVSLPANIAVQMGIRVQKVLYDDLELSSLSGQLSLEHQRAALKSLRFMLLGGEFSLQGNYQTPPKQSPRYDMSFDIKKLDIQTAYNNIDMLKKLAPVAKDVKGLLSTRTSIRGALKPDLSPIYESINGEGSISLQQGSLHLSKGTESLARSLKIKQQDGNWPIKNFSASISIKDGRLYVKPFTISQGDYPLTISGSNDLTGDIDYIVDTRVKTRLLAARAGISIPSNSSITLPTYTNIGVRMSGPYDSPKVTLKKDVFKVLQQQVVQAAKDALKKKAKEKGKKTAKKVKDRAKKQIKKLFGN